MLYSQDNEGEEEAEEGSWELDILRQYPMASTVGGCSVAATHACAQEWCWLPTLWGFWDLLWQLLGFVLPRCQHQV